MVALMFLMMKKGTVLREYKPTIKGEPTKDLVRLTGNCFFGITWMIKTNSDFDYHFKEGMSHGEDLLFFIKNSQYGEYSYTGEKIMCCRKGNVSAMSNVTGLEKGYWQIYNEVKTLSFVDQIDLFIMHFRIKKFMFLEYLSSKNYGLAIKSLFK